jgi:hypothetical protein
MILEVIVFLLAGIAAFAAVRLIEHLFTKLFDLWK